MTEMPGGCAKLAVEGPLTEQVADVAGRAFASSV